MAHEYVTVVNRTESELSGTFDGRQYVIKKGNTPDVPLDRAIKFVVQNPVMGSEDPRTGNIICKIGLLKEGENGLEESREYPTSELSPEFIKSCESPLGERWQRVDIGAVMLQPSRGGLYAGDWQSAQNPVGGFVPNK